MIDAVRCGFFFSRVSRIGISVLFAGGTGGGGLLEVRGAKISLAQRADVVPLLEGLSALASSGRAR